MNSPEAKYAWREIPRLDLPKRSVVERVADFLEIYAPLDQETAREQALRCVQCPHPVCVEACPLGNRIPDWLALTAEGHLLEAAELLQSTTCMGEVFSRLCTDPCERACVVNGPGESVSINLVERFLHDYSATHSGESAPPRPNGWRVAVLDSGPCGLACAHDLAREGCAVVVYDQNLLPGGLLVNGTPAFKVERTVVQRRLQYLEKLGVQFRLGVKCGLDLTLEQLRAEHDALFFGACAEEARPLTIPGAHLHGVYQALIFLIQQNLPVTLDLARLTVQGKRVVVLGAGDTAIDCLRSAVRSRAQEAVAVYRRDATSIPADPHEYRNACEEGARFVFLAEPVAVLGNAADEVTGVRCVRTRMQTDDAPERNEVEPIAGSEFVLPAEVVLVAFGYSAEAFCRTGDFSTIALDAEGRVLVDQNLMTNVPGVFAGGTFVRGRCPAVETVRDARKAARSIHQYLSQTSRPRHERPRV